MDDFCQKIINAFNNILSGNSIPLWETQLRKFSQNPNYILCLLKILLNQNFNPTYRQTSGVNLKNFIIHNWHLITPEKRKIVRDNILQGLNDQSSKIITTVCMIIGEIGKYDFPENWPNLITILLNIFQNPSTSSIKKYASIKCLSLVSEHFSTQHVQKLVDLIPIMIKFGSDQKNSEKIRSRAIYVMMNVFKLCGWCIDDPQYSRIGFQVFEKCCDGTFHFLCNSIRSPSINPTTTNRLKYTSLKCLFRLIDTFQDYLGKYALQILKCLYDGLKLEFNRYSKTCLIHGSYVEDKYDSEGENIGLKTMISEFLEVLLTCLTSCTFETFMNESFLSTIISLIIPYMQITEEEILLWKEDETRFVEDDDGSYNIRKAGGLLLYEMENIFEDKLLKILVIKFWEHFDCSIEMYKKKDRNWWKIREASLLALGSIIKEIDGKMFNFPRLFKILFENDLGDNSPQQLQKRAIWFIGETIKHQDSGTAAKFIDKIFLKLAMNYSFPLRIAASRTLVRYIKVCKENKTENIIKGYVLKIIEGICFLLEKSSAEIIHISLENLSVAIKFNPEIPHYQKIISYLFDLYTKFNYEPIVVMDILSCFESFSVTKGSHSFMLKVILPKGAKHMSNSKDVFFIAKLMEFFTVLTQYSRKEDIQFIVRAIFLPIYKLVMNVGDSNILQNGTCFFRSLIYTDSFFLQSTTLNWKNQNKSLLDLILNYVKQLLNLKIAEHMVLGVDKLINVILEKYGNVLQKIIPDILKSCILRMVYSKNLILSQGLLCVFIKLFSSNQKQFIIDFLDSFNLGNQHLKDLKISTDGQTSALSFILIKWTDHGNIIQGEYQRKLSLTTLVKLLLLNNKKIQSIRVPSETPSVLQPNENRGYATRSKGKINQQFIAFPLRSFVDLVQSLSYQMQTLSKKQQKENKIINYLMKYIPDEFNKKTKYTNDDYLFFSAFTPDDDDDDDDDTVDFYEKRESIMGVDLFEFLVKGIKELVRTNKQYFTHSIKYLDESKRKLLESVLNMNV